MVGLIALPKPFCFVTQFVDGPRRINPRLVIGNYLAPGLLARDVAVPAAANPISDDAAQRLEAGNTVGTTFMDSVSKEIDDRALGADGLRALAASLAEQRRHRFHSVSKFG